MTVPLLQGTASRRPTRLTFTPSKVGGGNLEDTGHFKRPAGMDGTKRKRRCIVWWTAEGRDEAETPDGLQQRNLRDELQQRNLSSNQGSNSNSL